MRPMIVLAAAIMAVVQASVPVIDLSGNVARNRKHEPTTASLSGGGSGGSRLVAIAKAPLEIRLLSVSLDHSETEPYAIFEAELKNVSDRKLDLPIDPNLADLEPESPTAAYSYVSCDITLQDPPPRGESFSESMSLYGSAFVTGSMKTLEPEGTLRIRARVRLKSKQSRNVSDAHARPVAAMLSLRQNTVSERKGVLHQDSMSIAPEVISSNLVDFTPAP